MYEGSFNRGGVFLYAIAIAGAVIALDQFIKALVIERIMPVSTLEIIKGFFYITYVENRGISFGLFKGNREIFIVLTLVISLIMCYYIFKFYKRHISVTICLAFILGGAIGNVIDRIRFGYVVDFIHFTIFPPVFNLADSAIVCGAMALSAILLLNKDIAL